RSLPHPSLHSFPTRRSSDLNTSIVIPDALRKLTVIFDRWAPISLAERGAMIRELTDSTLPVLTRDLRLWANDLEAAPNAAFRPRSEEHTSELQSRSDLVCRL